MKSIIQMRYELTNVTVAESCGSLMMDQCYYHCSKCLFVVSLLPHLLPLLYCTIPSVTQKDKL